MNLLDPNKALKDSITSLANDVKNGISNDSTELNVDNKLNEFTMRHSVLDNKLKNSIFLKNTHKQSWHDKLNNINAQIKILKIRSYFIINPKKINDHNNSIEFQGIQKLDSKYYDAFKTHILTLTESNNLCVNINPGYIKDALDNNDILICYCFHANDVPINDYQVQNFGGFALLGINETDIHVELICTVKNSPSGVNVKGFGKLLINAISCVGTNINVSTITLDSVESAVSFYSKLGFKTGDQDDNDDLQRMNKQIDNGDDYCNKLIPASTRGGGRRPRKSSKKKPRGRTTRRHRKK